MGGICERMRRSKIISVESTHGDPREVIPEGIEVTHSIPFSGKSLREKGHKFLIADRNVLESIKKYGIYYLLSSNQVDIDLEIFSKGGNSITKTLLGEDGRRTLSLGQPLSIEKTKEGRRKLWLSITTDESLKEWIKVENEIKKIYQKYVSNLPLNKSARYQDDLRLSYYSTNVNTLIEDKPELKKDLLIQKYLYLENRFQQKQRRIDLEFLSNSFLPIEFDLKEFDGLKIGLQTYHIPNQDDGFFYQEPLSEIPEKTKIDIFPDLK